MSKNKDGGSAFPVVESENRHSVETGMSLRDYFAAKAMGALIKAKDGLKLLNGAPEYPLEENLAEASYKIANSMLAERAKAQT